MKFLTVHFYRTLGCLWCMARRGYTLQRSRKDLAFRDIVDDVKAATARRNELSFAFLKSTPPEKQG